MTIEEAVESLKAKLNTNQGQEDEGIFIVRHDGTSILVDVEYIYRVEDVKKLGDTWEGFPLICGGGKTRISCW
jgi:hypothetical protein